MKVKGLKENALRSAARSAALCGVASAVALAAAFVMSFWAEPLKQEIGYGTTMLGYNRDFLVNGRWYFFAGIVVSLMLAFHSFKKTNEGK